MNTRPLIRKIAKPSVYNFVLCVCLMLIVPPGVRGQKNRSEASPSPTASPTPSQSTATSAGVLTAPPTPGPKPRVTEILTKRAGLGDPITLRGQNLETLVKQATCADATPNCQKQEIVLFLNGRPVTDEAAEMILPEEQKVQFHLSRASEDEELWADLLGSPESFEKTVKASVGLEDGYPLENAQGFSFIVIRQWPFVGCFVLVAVVLIGIYFFGRKTVLLRESNSKTVDGKFYPYSLGRTQMAFWFVLTLTSFLLIWLVTGEYGSITSSTLVLIGIGAGTALGATLLNNSKNSTVSDQISNYKAEKATLSKRIDEIKPLFADPNSPPTNSADLQKELDAKEVRLHVVDSALEQLPTQPEALASQGFIKDILNDSDGVSFHRFQIVVWTVVLGIIFVTSVYHRLAMPEFSGTLLALMGISSGTYLGFKGAEK